ncbi:DUF1016 domain-containing protein [Bacteroides salyersiae]|nr:DUF1016 domain-containing protein [Bacteroides salyersiae]
MAQEVVKDPYWFDFVSVSQKARERDIEKQLVTHITQFLLELGKGFAFVGEQYCLNLNNKEYFCDLLFYHIPLRALRSYRALKMETLNLSTWDS